jgi:hypothetical protein
VDLRHAVRRDVGGNGMHRFHVRMEVGDESEAALHGDVRISDVRA